MIIMLSAYGLGNILPCFGHNRIDLYIVTQSSAVRSTTKQLKFSHWITDIGMFYYNNDHWFSILPFCDDALSMESNSHWPNCFVCVFRVRFGVLMSVCNHPWPYQFVQYQLLEMFWNKWNRYAQAHFGIDRMWSSSIDIHTPWQNVLYYCHGQMWAKSNGILTITYRLHEIKITEMRRKDEKSREKE